MDELDNFGKVCSKYSKINEIFLFSNRVVLDVAYFR